jgi:hypothetical protein
MYHDEVCSPLPATLRRITTLSFLCHLNISQHVPLGDVFNLNYIIEVCDVVILVVLSLTNTLSDFSTHCVVSRHGWFPFLHTTSFHGAVCRPKLAWLNLAL